MIAGSQQHHHKFSTKLNGKNKTHTIHALEGIIESLDACNHTNSYPIGVKTFDGNKLVVFTTEEGLINDVTINYTKSYMHLIDSEIEIMLKG